MENPLQKEHLGDLDSVTRKYEKYFQGFSLKELYEAWLFDKDMPPAIHERLSRTLTRPSTDEAFVHYPFPADCDDPFRSFRVVVRFGNRDAGWPNLPDFPQQVSESKELREDIINGLTFWLNQEQIPISTEDYSVYWDVTDFLINFELKERLSALIKHHPLNPAAPFWFDTRGGQSTATHWLLNGTDWSRQVALEQILDRAAYEREHSLPTDTTELIKHIVLCAALYRGTDDELSLPKDDLTQLISFLETYLPPNEQYAVMGAAAKLTDLITNPEIAQLYARRHLSE